MTWPQFLLKRLSKDCGMCILYYTGSNLWPCYVCVWVLPYIRGLLWPTQPLAGGVPLIASLIEWQLKSDSVEQLDDGLLRPLTVGLYLSFTGRANLTIKGLCTQIGNIERVMPMDISIIYVWHIDVIFFLPKWCMIF